VLANQVLVAQLDHNRGDPRIYWHDYPAARQRLVDHLVKARVRNPVIITGDPTEFAGTSIKFFDGDRRGYVPPAEPQGVAHRSPYGPDRQPPGHTDLDIRLVRGRGRPAGRRAGVSESA
jgi:phosphodiesterase/alkaline phosphatase D-like protein